MALTAQQMSDARRWAGYPMLGDVVASDNTDSAYAWVSSGEWRTLYNRLTNLRPEEETTLITVYLTPLATLENDIPGAGDNLDTDRAAVWFHNRDEVKHRRDLFDDWRRRMCYFIGIPPGPSLGADSGTVSLTRA